MSEHDNNRVRSPTVGNGPRLDDILKMYRQGLNNKKGTIDKLDKKVQQYYEELFRLFRSFLEKNYSLENLLFYLEVDEFKGMSPPSPNSRKQGDNDRLHKAEEIYKQFLKSGSQYQLNVDANMKKAVKQQLKAVQLNTDHSTVVDLNLFESIQKAIYLLLAEDSYPKFLKSESYKKFAVNSKVAPTTSMLSPEDARKKRSSGSRVGLPRSGTETPPTVATQTEVELVQCRDHAQYIMNMLKDREEAEASEYIATLQEMTNVLEAVIKDKIQVPESVVKEMHIYIRDYHLMLEQKRNMGRLGRFITSQRMKSKMDQSNYGVHLQVEKVLPHCAGPVTQSPNPSPNSTLRKISNLFSTTGNSSNSYNNSGIFYDDAGKAFWDRSFGMQVLWVPWDEFLRALELGTDSKIFPDEVRILKFFLDGANLGALHQYRFSEFLKGFGPMKTETSNCVENMRDIVKQRWFYGFLTKFESEYLLTDRDVGTFLVRFAKSKAGSFAIAYVNSTNRVSHLILESCKPFGFKVQDAPPNRDKTYATLFEVISAHNDLLKAPMKSGLPFKKWFWGDVTSLECSDLLHEQNTGTFLIRLSSSQSNAYAATYVDESKQVKSLIIQRKEDRKYEIAESNETFDSLVELVQSKSSLLQTPLVNLSSETSDVIKKWRRMARKEDSFVHSKQ